MAPSESRSIVVTGAAGLVGQNLIPRLKARGFGPIVAIDKHPANTAILARLHPDITTVKADLSQPGAWRDSLDRKSTRLNSSHVSESRMPSSA